MKLSTLTYIWLVITAVLSYEYLVLHKTLPGPGLIDLVICKRLAMCEYKSPAPGRPLSYAFGWLGFCIMSLTNLYVIRKRLHSLHKWGSVQSWLNYHIFCGMLGPTLILFHCDFKVRGLVSISFWSMIVSFASGIVGRFFYMQLLQGKGLLKRQIETLEQGFDQYVKISGPRVPAQAMLAAKAQAFAMAGGMSSQDLQEAGILNFMMKSSLGSLRMSVGLPPTPWRESRAFRVKLKEWAVLRKRLIFMHYYQLLFGYWRTFHTPFAVWMYIVAVIHIASSLIFRV